MGGVEGQRAKPCGASWPPRVPGKREAARNGRLSGRELPTAEGPLIPVRPGLALHVDLVKGGVFRVTDATGHQRETHLRQSHGRSAVDQAGCEAMCPRGIAVRCRTREGVGYSTVNTPRERPAKERQTRWGHTPPCGTAGASRIPVEP